MIRDGVIRKLIALLAMLCYSVGISVSAQTATPPALQTELSQHGVSLKPEIMSASRGVFSNTSDLLRSPDYAKVINNLQMLKRGVWTTKGTGFTNESGATTGTSDVVHTIGHHSSITYGEEHVAFYGSKAKLCNSATGEISGSELATGLSTYGDTLSYNSTYFIYTGGTSASHEPKMWDGNPAGTFATLTSWPPTINAVSYTKPAYVERFAGRACFGRMSTRPYSVVLSKQDDPTGYTISSPVVATDPGVFDVPSELGYITGLKTFRVAVDEQVLVIGCQNGVAMITGSSATDFALKVLTREFGVRGDHTWIELGNDLLFLASDGVRRLSQLIGDSNLKTAALTQPIEDIMQVANTFALYRWPVAAHHPATKEVLFYMSPLASGTSTLDKGVILNYNLPENDGSPFPAAFAISTKNGLGVACIAEYNGVMLHGDPAGTYIMHDYTGDTYNGSGISWTFTSGLVGGNSPSQSASAKKFVILTDGGRQKFTAKAYTYEQLGNGITQLTLRETRSIDVSGASATDLATWATSTTTSYPKFIDFGPKGSGRYWLISLSGTATTDGIDLVGIQSILTVGGLKQ